MCLFNFKANEWPFEQDNNNNNNNENGKKPKRNQPKNKANPPPNRLRSVLADARNIWVAPCPGRGRGRGGWALSLPVFIAF